MSTDSQQKFDFSFLPPKLDDKPDSERVFRTSLPSSEYLRLETEAFERGVTGFRLSGLILSAYLNGKLISTE